jgi:hypothetical protein
MHIIDYLGFTLIFVIVTGILIGSSPVVRIAAPDANECRHALITRYWGTVTIIDTVMCEGDAFKFNGKELINDVQE